MNTKIVWGFDGETREYTREVTCYPCPETPDAWILPKHYLEVAAPATNEHEVAVAGEADWTIEADYRDQVFYDAEGDQHTITERGVVPEPSWTVHKPLSLDEQFENVRWALQGAIDHQARALGFSGGNALMLYATFSNPYQTLALPFAEWEATVWFEANAYKAQVQAEAAPMVTPEQAVAMMPELVIPAEEEAAE